MPARKKDVELAGSKASQIRGICLLAVASEHITWRSSSTSWWSPPCCTNCSKALGAMSAAATVICLFFSVSVSLSTASRPRLKPWDLLLLCLVFRVCYSRVPQPGFLDHLFLRRPPLIGKNASPKQPEVTCPPPRTPEGGRAAGRGSSRVREG